MIAREVTDYVFQIAPNPTSAAENIYELGGPDLDVSGIGVAWWITSEILEDFVRRKLTLGLTHERVIYDTVSEGYRWGRACPAAELQANRRHRILKGRGQILWQCERFAAA